MRPSVTINEKEMGEWIHKDLLPQPPETGKDYMKHQLNQKEPEMSYEEVPLKLFIDQANLIESTLNNKK